jgi:hypothetical protein
MLVGTSAFSLVLLAEKYASYHNYLQIATASQHVKAIITTPALIILLDQSFRRADCQLWCYG